MQLEKNQQEAKLPQSVLDMQMIEEITDQMKTALSNLYQNQKDCIQLQQDYLKDLAQAIQLWKCPWLNELKHKEVKVKKLAKKIKELRERE